MGRGEHGGGAVGTEAAGAAPGPVVIGLDVGTTGVKAAAFAPGSSWRAVAERDHPLRRPAPGEEVQDPAEILDAAAGALSACVAAAGGAEVRGVALSCAMHGLVALDGDGRPLTPLLTWADHRADAEARELAAAPQAGALAEATGLMPQPMTPLAKVAWFARHDTATFSQARTWAGMKELIVSWLTGTVATELSSASATGLLELSAGRWSPLALGLCGLEADRLPPILATTATLPLRAPVAARLGLAAGTPIVVGAADGPLANLGVGALAPDVAGCSLGTSGALRVCVEGPQRDPDHQLFCYALGGPLWVAGGALSNGAGVLQFLAEALAPDLAEGGPDLAGGGRGGESPEVALLELAARVPPGSEGAMMIPFVLGERAPLWDPALAGAFVGLRHGHTRGHLVRAAAEGVCFQMRLLLERLERVHTVREIRATGGAFRSTLWRDLAAAALGRPLVVVSDREGTALGAAALGLYALGDAPDLAAARDLIEAPDGAGAGRGEAVEPRRELVEAFEAMRSSLPNRLAALERATGDDR